MRRHSVDGIGVHPLLRFRATTHGGDQNSLYLKFGDSKSENNVFVSHQSTIFNVEINSTDKINEVMVYVYRWIPIRLKLVLGRWARNRRIISLISKINPFANQFGNLFTELGI